ncbi:MAG: procyclic acidic repetitive family protein [Clostridia bacterium]|nr:procyclic acidic repetitive family protein [Clostridia bacterium]
MKKLISIFLVIVMIFALVACGGKNKVDEQVNEDSGQVQENVNTETNKDEVKEENPEDDKKDEKNPANVTDKKPEAKPETNPETKPETKPEAKPEVKPETKPEEKPAPQASTAGEKLLADFNAKAGSSSSATALAEAISQNPIIPFSAMAVPVEPGFLAGFGNTEIKGFKEGAMFGPVIGSVPFVGYVFVLEDGVSASDFISTLKSNADLRWNICVEAEEMVAGSVGNKVFFVMCNKDLNAQE